MRLTIGLISLPMIVGMFSKQGIIKRLALTHLKPLTISLALSSAHLLPIFIIIILLIIANTLFGYGLPGFPCCSR